MRYLLDTSVISKRYSYAKARIWIGAHQAQIVLSVLTIAEIQRGIERLSAGPKRKGLKGFLDELLSDYPVLVFDTECAAAWAGYVERAGRPVPLMDSLIAAIAIAHNLQLVTDNEKDFPHMDLVNPLK